jgi:hypothetical protein
MKKKHLSMSAAAFVFAGLVAVATVTPATAARGSLTPDPHHLNCGAQPVAAGPKSCGQVTFTNNTSTTIIIGSVAIGTRDAPNDYNAAGFSCINGTPLAPGSSCFVNITFDPSQTGHRHSTLIVSESTFDTFTTVGLAGRGTA